MTQARDPKFKNHSLWQCRLCWKITLSIFFCILLIEGLILIPIYTHFQKNQLNQLNHTGLNVIKTLFFTLGPNPTPSQVIKSSALLTDKTPLKGATIMHQNGTPFVQFGEKPGFISPQNQRLDVAWDSKMLNLPFDITARLDRSEMTSTLNTFILQSATLLMLMTILITLATLIILRKILLGPILMARKNLMAAALDPTHPERFIVETDRSDEIGDLFRKFNDMLKRIGDGLKNIKAHEAILELRIEERTHELLQLANYDLVTELPNLNLFQERLSQAITQVQQQKKNVVVLILELQDFREISNVFGHQLANVFLKQVGEYLSEQLPSHNTLARVGPDQFGILRIGLTGTTQASDFAQWILDLFLNPILVGTQNILTTVNVGISVYPNDGDNAENLVTNANLALNRAKAYIQNSYQFYESGMNEKIGFRRNLLTDLHGAVEQNQMELFYQPKVNLQKNQITGMEALIRWRHPEKGLISPVDFIPLAEESGLIISIGEWVLKTACLQTRKWHQEGLPPLCVAVNLSAIQFKQKNIIETVNRILTETELSPEYLELEITESAIMNNIQEAISTMKALRALGISLSIDDFGTGYSSLSYLKRFPIQKLKIDQSFVKDLGQNQDDRNLAEIIIYLGHSLNLQVIAEGIDNEAKMNYLKVKGCDIGQGYYFGKPTEASKFPEFFKDVKS